MNLHGTLDDQEFYDMAQPATQSTIKLSDSFKDLFLDMNISDLQ